MLLGNKMDISEGQRQIDFEQAQDFAQREAILFSEVSALQRKRFESVLRTIRSKLVMVLQQYPNLETLLLKSKSKRSINRSSSIEENESHMLQDSVRHETRIRPA